MNVVPFVLRKPAAVTCPVHRAPCAVGCEKTPNDGCLSTLKKVEADAAMMGTTLEALRREPDFDEWLEETLLIHSMIW